MTTAHDPSTGRVADATCLACGCLCDDLVIETAGSRIVAAKNACALGLRWLQADHAHAGLPAATIDGRHATPDDALDRAAAVLARARAPVVLGLTATSTEAVAAALAVADVIGAVVDPGASEGDRARLRGVQRVGRVSSTLGEVKSRADVVVFWGVDPVSTHPRHWERYSVDPRGRFVAEGRAGRTVIVADAAPTATSRRADEFVQVAAHQRLETLATLRALVRGASVDPERVGRATGLGIETLAALAATLKAARYGAWFFDPGTAQADESDAALCLVRDLNAFTRFVILPLGGAGNAAGAEAVLTWQTGHAASVSLASGAPRALPGATSADALLSSGAADVALIVADLEPGGLSGAARARLSQIPRVVIAPGATRDSGAIAVAIDTATCGIDAGGTVMRVDGVVLPLRPPLTPRVPTDRERLEALGARLSARAVRT